MLRALPRRSTSPRWSDTGRSAASVMGFGADAPSGAAGREDARTSPARRWTPGPSASRSAWSTPRARAPARRSCSACWARCGPGGASWCTSAAGTSATCRPSTRPWGSPGGRRGDPALPPDRPLRGRARRRPARSGRSVERARDEGLDVTCDQHPFTTSNAVADVRPAPVGLRGRPARPCAPGWPTRPPAADLKAYREPQNKLIVAGQWELIVVVAAPHSPHLLGRPLDVLAAERRAGAGPTTCSSTPCWPSGGTTSPPCACGRSGTSTRTVLREALTHPLFMFESDGQVLAAGRAPGGGAQPLQLRLGGPLPGHLRPRPGLVAPGGRRAPADLLPGPASWAWPTGACSARACAPTWWSSTPPRCAPTTRPSSPSRLPRRLPPRLRRRRPRPCSTAGRRRRAPGGCCGPA